MNILGYAVNSGHPAFGPYVGQNSQVVSVGVAFGEEVDLDEGAITLALYTNGVTFDGVEYPSGMGSVPDLSQQTYGIPDQKNWYVAFQGTEPAFQQAGSLADGVYILTVDGNKVHPKGQSGNGPSGTFLFHRLFGKMSGPDFNDGIYEARVKSSDNLIFQTAYDNNTDPDYYQIALDGDADHSNGDPDLAKFTANFNKPLCWAE